MHIWEVCTYTRRTCKALQACRVILLSWRGGWSCSALAHLVTNVAHICINTHLTQCPPAHRLPPPCYPFPSGLPWPCKYSSQCYHLAISALEIHTHIQYRLPGIFYLMAWRFINCRHATTAAAFANKNWGTRDVEWVRKACEFLRKYIFFIYCIRFGIFHQQRKTKHRLVGYKFHFLFLYSPYAVIGGWEFNMTTSFIFRPYIKVLYLRLEFLGVSRNDECASHSNLLPAMWIFFFLTVHENLM